MEDLENQGGKPTRRTLDLSLAQVAASALAAVVGAVLASQLGVYGTILGAAVVSVGATTGTAVFQHLFRRTGEQLRERATTPTPIEQAPPAAGPAGAAEAQVFDPFDRGGEHTRMMARINPPDQAEAVAVYRGRPSLKPKSWKVYAVTAAIVFALAMGTVGVIELASGKPAANLFGGGDEGGARPKGGTSAPVDPSPGASTGRGAGTGGTRDTAEKSDSRTSATPGASGASAGPEPSGSAGTKPDPATPKPTPDDSAATDGSGSGASPSVSAAPQTAPSP
ncbi:hypothetical protein [Streptacidiphilus neutrinimicus]|uniref:hypothetical protein n=1 Tax=Streptacidiphilus neutrinimicus TaxID=105420 RepID=UPI000A75E7DC|nr:hypothetical protein [Streptacidiphilus neutrinimicus]